MQQIGDRIHSLRKGLGISQGEFGSKIGIKKASVSSMEKNKSNPSTQTIKLICIEFNVNYDWLVDGVGDIFIKNNNSIHERIKYLRKDILHLTQIDFGKKIGIAGTTVTGWEKRNMKPSETALKTICNEFNVNYNWLVDGDGNIFIESSLIEKYGRIEAVENWDDVTVPANLKSKAEKKLAELILVNRTITAKAVDLFYSNENIPYFKIGDVIPIISKPHGIDTTAILTERTRNLNNPVEDTFTLGTEKKTLSSSVNDSNNATNEIENKITGNFLNDLIKNQTKLLANGKDGNIFYGFNAQGKLSELYFTDTDNIATAVDVIRLNNKGIGFSNDGFYGSYKNAWTIDGTLNADFIKAGTM